MSFALPNFGKANRALASSLMAKAAAEDSGWADATSLSEFGADLVADREGHIEPYIELFRSWVWATSTDGNLLSQILSALPHATAQMVFENATAEYAVDTIVAVSHRGLDRLIRVTALELGVARIIHGKRCPKPAERHVLIMKRSFEISFLPARYRCWAYPGALNATAWLVLNPPAPSSR